jgi:hypothetical protein
MADAMLSVASLSFAESYAVEDDVVVGARARAREFGCTPIGPAGAATLRVLAAAAGARSSRSAPAPGCPGCTCSTAWPPTAC